MRFEVGLLIACAAALCPAAAAGASGPGEQPPADMVHALPGPDLPERSSPSPAAAQASGTISRDKLRRKLRKLARQAPGSSGFYVFDVGAERKRVIFGRKEGKRRKLASNTKLFTTATALHRFGAKRRLETVVRARGKVNGNGRLEGDLYLAGGGDPTLASAGVRSLAKQVKRSGIKRVKGRIFADDSIFDRKRGVPDSGWGPSPYIAPLSGLVYSGSTYSADPAMEAASALQIFLRRRGVKVSKKARIRRTPRKLRSREPIASTPSPTVANLIEATNEPSNNFFAEMLLKGVAAEAGGRGTTKRGTRVVERFARSKGSRVDAKDGSGLTDDNRAAPRDVVRLLVAMREHRDGEAFIDSLPVAGKEGTLDERMEGTAAAGRCRAKTGTITGVSALSGFCEAGHGRVAFSLLMNGVGNYDAARSIQDKMAIAIARYRP